MVYDPGQNKRSVLPKKRLVFVAIIFMLIAAATLLINKYVLTSQTAQEQTQGRIIFDESVTQDEQNIIREKIQSTNIALNNDVLVSVETSLEVENLNNVIDVYVPVTDVYSVLQDFDTSLISEDGSGILVKASHSIAAAISKAIMPDSDVAFATIEDNAVANKDAVRFVPIDNLNYMDKLLSVDGFYYLDNYDLGAVFRQVIIDGEDVETLAGLTFNDLVDEEDIYKVNMTGVTALTRVMMRKLASVQDPLYFSAKIGDFLSDADLTHVSNEVSFKEGCSYSNTSFCSPPEFIETLKASGVDLVELTGNHNNDQGSELNTATIELYNSLGIATYGGGINATEARKPFITDAKDTSIAFLAYNFPDSPNSGAIASESSAGANSFELGKIEEDIETAKQTADFVIVNIQYWECYAYPSGYIEYPVCDKPIGEQEQDFKKVVDLGADMVIGSSAHQPQTYEIYKDKPIYYGLGNMYFDQTSWPGTERGIILTHYFSAGKLLQTKLTPTVYDADLQTRAMTASETEYLLSRLQNAR